MRVVVVVFMFLLTVGQVASMAQNDYYFKKWKGKGLIEADAIYFSFDSTLSENGKILLEKFSNIVSTNLLGRGISVRCGHQPIESIANEMLIKLELEAPAFVHLNFPQPNGIPLCNRFRVSQLSVLPSKSRNQINTIISVSVDKETEGLVQAANEFSDLIYRSLVK